MSELIHFECLRCRKSLSAQRQHAGRSTKCPGCLCLVKVPPLIVETEDAFQFAEDAGPTAKPPQRHPRNERYRHTKADDQGGTAELRRPCPACGEEIKQVARKCLYCGEVLDPSYMAKNENRAGVSYRDKAFTGFCLSLAGGLLCFFPLAIFGVAMSVGALFQMSTSKNGEGKVFAITGAIIGGITVVFWGAWFVLWANLLADLMEKLVDIL